MSTELEALLRKAVNPHGDVDVPALAEKIKKLLAVPQGDGVAQEQQVRLSASEVACYRWPEDTAEHRAMRAAFMDGAASMCGVVEQPALCSCEPLYASPTVKGDRT